MYPRKEMTTKILVLKILRKELEKLIKIFEKYSDEEEQFKHVALFLKNMPHGDSAVDFSEVRQLCRLFCSYRMNSTALMLEVTSKKKSIEDQISNIKREMSHLIDVLEKAEKLLKNVKFVEQKERKALSVLIINEFGKFVQLAPIFKEFVEITEMVCTKELNPLEASCEYRMLIHHLDFLGDKIIR